MKTIAVILVFVAVASSLLIKSNEESRVEGGELASPGQFPYAVVLKRSAGPLCGGVIVGPRHVLTESWCYYIMGNITILPNCMDYFSPDCVQYSVENVWIHPNASDVGQNDLAVISVTEDFVLSNNVSIATLSEEFVESGVSGSVMGWTPELEYVNVTVAECDQVDETIICSSPSVVSFGVYGSPFVVDGIIAGISVDGFIQDKHQRLSLYVPWIRSIVEGNL